MIENRKSLLIISLLIFLISAGFLISGAELLVYPLGRKTIIPLGNITTWLGIMALSFAVFFSHRSFYTPSKQFFSLTNVLKLFIILAVFWFPISYGLAGNYSFTYTEKPGFQGGQMAMKIFWNYTYTVVAAPIVLFFFQKFIFLLK